MAFAGLAVVTIGLVLFGIVVKAIRPYHESGEQVRQLAVTKRQVAELDAENAAIRVRINYLKTPAGIITEARQAGYLKPGEIPFVVEGNPAAPINQAVQPATKSTALNVKSRINRAWHALVDH